jgi:hypothetical protein
LLFRWCVVDTGKLVGKPQKQGYDEHSSKFPSVVKQRFIESVGERTKLPKVDARKLCDTPDNGVRKLVGV